MYVIFSAGDLAGETCLGGVGFLSGKGTVRAGAQMFQEKCHTHSAKYPSGNLLFTLVQPICSLRQQVATVIWHKAASPPQTDGSIVFARWRQCTLPFLAPPDEYDWTGASFGPPEFSTKRHLDWFIGFCTGKSPYTLQWVSLSPKIVPFSWEIWTSI